MSELVEDAIRRLRVARSINRMPTDLADQVEAMLRNQCGDTMRQKEAARFLGVSERTLRNWHSENKGPPRQHVGRVSLYSRATLQRWIRDPSGGK